AALKRQGITDPQRRVAVVGRGDWAVSLFKKQPFTPEELDRLRDHAERIGGHLYYWPQVLPSAEQARAEADYYRAAPAPVVEGNRAFSRCIEAYRDGTEAEFFRSYVYNVAPTTDNSPFFFEYHFLNAAGLPTG